MFYRDAMTCVEALEQIDADSWGSLCGAVPASVRESLQLHSERRGDIVLTRCLVNDAPLANRALALGIRQPLTLETLLALKEEFQSFGLKNFALQVSPHGMRGLNEAKLAAAGLVPRGYWVKLIRGDAAVAEEPSLDIVVRELVEGDAMQFGEISALGFGRPPIIAHWMGATVGYPEWRHFLATVNGQPAGAAAMYFRDGYAWLGIGSTLPEFRQRGVQQQLIAARLRAGLARGVRHFIAETESRNASCQNLMRAGFEIAYERPNYGLPVEMA